MNPPAIVEPLVTDQAWVCNGYPVRRTIQLREVDLSLLYACMVGSGAKEAAYSRWVFQKGLHTVIMEKMEAANASA